MVPVRFIAIVAFLLCSVAGMPISVEPSNINERSINGINLQSRGLSGLFGIAAKAAGSLVKVGMKGMKGKKAKGHKKEEDNEKYTGRGGRERLREWEMRLRAWASRLREEARMLKRREKAVRRREKALKKYGANQNNDDSQNQDSR
ncbi:hypothetical protein APHAL10511_008253 [Amanita phalloides]|nr:hypothetical protein APHAL10511_008253 [Amanita phalloides]